MEERWLDDAWHAGARCSGRGHPEAGWGRVWLACDALHAALLAQHVDANSLLTALARVSVYDVVVCVCGGAISTTLTQHTDVSVRSEHCDTGVGCPETSRALIQYRVTECAGRQAQTH